MNKILIPLMLSGLTMVALWAAIAPQIVEFNKGMARGQVQLNHE